MLLLTTPAFSQGDLNIFGFFQGQVGIVPEDPAVKEKPTRTFYATQQLNLFFSKDLGSNFDAFINLEFINNYNSRNDWGKFNIEEAWLKYEFSPLLKIKAGQLIPQYGLMNEVKNKMPFLPYIMRPAVYESTIDELQIMQLYDYVPTHAFLQIYGTNPVGRFNFDYAIFLGNAEPDYANDKPSRSFTTNQGIDSSQFKTVGGRIGFRYNSTTFGSLKFGASFAVDKDNLTQVLGVANLGHLHRNRFGFDLSIEAHGFMFEGEYMKTIYDENEAADMKRQGATALGVPLGKGFDKMFYFGTLGYYFTEKLFVYGGYSFTEDQLMESLEEGISLIYGGLTYRVNDSIVLKGQYNHLQLEKSPKYDYYKMDPTYLGISVLF